MSIPSNGDISSVSVNKKYILFLSILAIIIFVRFSFFVPQPEIESRNAGIIREGAYSFRDLNKNGSLDPYEDWRLSVEERITDLVGKMTIEEKAGLMFHPNIAVTPDGEVNYDLSARERRSLEGVGYGENTGQTMAMATAKSYIEEKNFRCILNDGVAEPVVFAQWSNSMQEIAEKSRLGIPILFSSDPRHGSKQGVHIRGEQYFSQWPGIEGQYGITAARNPELMKKFGEVTAEEYRAVGLHMILGPQIDVTTEPRWHRNFGSFSESAELTSEMLSCFMEGAQGKSVGSSRILVMLKHWPGSGPHKDGSGDWLVYPGNNFDYHLIPWKTGIKNGALAVMGYYSGTYYDTLGVNFSKYISTEVLYDQLGFEGSICSDWNVIGRKGALNPVLVGMPLEDRFEMSINAGVDQFGGETMPEVIVELVKKGRIPESRIDLAASRILQWHFRLGLFEDPYVDPVAAGEIVKSEKNMSLGYQAQLESVVMLSNQDLLPFSGESTVPYIYISGLDSTIASGYGRIVKNPEDADLAIIKVESTGNASRDSDDLNISFPEENMELIRDIATKTSSIVAINLNRSLVVLPDELFDIAKATFMVFDIQDDPLFDVIFGYYNPSGSLPFELPSSMKAVREQLEDVPFDSRDPLFEFGYGLSFK